ncbi:DNA adenine methylase [Lacisediminihabitans sp. FW035]
MTAKSISTTPFLPAYVGSKRRWLEELEPLARGKNIVELFAGSAIISATFASKALIVDTDPNLCRVLSRYDELDVPDTFSAEDYDAARTVGDWWRSGYYLAAMCRGGIWRWSKKGGFNVQARNAKTYSRREGYLAALRRWRELKPVVRNTSYLDITNEDIREFANENVLVICDPPYEGTSPQYVDGFDFSAYWKRVGELALSFDVVVFDLRENLVRAGFPIDAVKTLSGLGEAKRNCEAMTFLPAGTRLALAAGKHLIARKSSRQPMAPTAPKSRSKDKV